MYRCGRRVAIRVVLHDRAPGRGAFGRFRTQHRETLGNLLEPTVTLAADMNLVEQGTIAT